MILPAARPCARTRPLRPVSLRVAPSRRVELRRRDGCARRRDDRVAPSTSRRGRGESDAWRDGSATVSAGAGPGPLRIGAEGSSRRIFPIRWSPCEAHVALRRIHRGKGFEVVRIVE